jgi:hypothetical protein
VQGQGLVDVVVVLPERGHVGGLRRRSDEGGRAGGASPEHFFTATLVIGSICARSLHPSPRWRGRQVGRRRRFDARAAARCGQKAGPLQLPMMQILMEWGWERLKRRPRQCLRCARARGGHLRKFKRARWDAQLAK